MYGQRPDGLLRFGGVMIVDDLFHRSFFEELFHFGEDFFFLVGEFRQVPFKAGESLQRHSAGIGVVDLFHGGVAAALEGQRRRVLSRFFVEKGSFFELSNRVSLLF